MEWSAITARFTCTTRGGRSGFQRDATLRAAWCESTRLRVVPDPSTRQQAAYRPSLRLHVVGIADEKPPRVYRPAGATEEGLELRKLLLDKTIDLDPISETFLLLADRLEHVRKIINPALEENKNVYVDFGEKDLIYFDPVCKNFFK